MSKHDEFPTKPDYEAKYKALEQAVKDAIDITMTYYSICMSTGSNHEGEEDFADGLERAIQILTEKTGITA